MDATNSTPHFVDDVSNSGEQTLPIITELEMECCPQFEEELVDNNSGLEILNNCVNESDRVSETEEMCLKVPEIGMIFHSHEEAFKFYKAYGYYSGFGVRKRSNYNFYGQKSRCVFTCCKEGKPYATTKITKLRRKPVIRTGCKARFIIVDRCLNSNWVVDDFFLEHNHDLEPQMVRFMRCYRELPLTVQRQLIVNDKTGVPLNKSINAMFTQGGGFDKCLFTEKDCKNFVSKHRSLDLVDGDAVALIKYFERLQNDDSQFFYSIDVTDDNKLKNVFWADSRCQMAFNHFGDVMTFDSTYLTNRYAMPFAPFVGVNHHGNSILFGCALLCDESSETFSWLFKRFLACMHGKHPNGIITDQCRAMESAILEVFPFTKHRLCLWHIMRKLPEKLGGRLDKQLLISEFSSIIYDSLSVDEFECNWFLVMGKYELTENNWFLSLFEKRANWVPIFLKDFFWAGISTTQRSEGVNAFFDGYVNSKTTLRLFVEQYENALKDKLEKQAQADFKSYISQPQLISDLVYEEQLSKLYTLNIFYKFQDEIKKLMNCSCSNAQLNGSFKIYMVTVWDGMRRLDFRVIHNLIEEDFWCICRSFQFSGIVCSHILCVLRQEGNIRIPDKLVSLRWRKDYKQFGFQIDSSTHTTNVKNISNNYYVEILRHANEIADIGGLNDEARAYTLNAFQELKEKIKDFCGHGVSNIIKDPVRAHPKGRPPTKRLASNHERKGKKKLKT